MEHSICVCWVRCCDRDTSLKTEMESNKFKMKSTIDRIGQKVRLAVRWNWWKELYEKYANEMNKERADICLCLDTKLKIPYKDTDLLCFFHRNWIECFGDLIMFWLPPVMMNSFADCFLLLLKYIHNQPFLDMIQFSSSDGLRVISTTSFVIYKICSGISRFIKQEIS